jgi:hypothetical protein
VKSEEKIDGWRTLFNIRVVDSKNLVEVANNHQTILIYVSILRQAYLCLEYK